jgi:hypothetical protein
MEGKKIASTVLLVGGIVILVLSLAADLVGIGGNPAFGRDQIIVAIVGAIVTVVGLVLRLRK